MPHPWPQLSHETNSCENGSAFLALENGDQALTAKPGYCGDAPRRGGAVVISFRHGSNSLLKFLEQQSENALALEWAHLDTASDRSHRNMAGARLASAAARE